MPPPPRHAPLPAAVRPSCLPHRQCVRRRRWRRATGRASTQHRHIPHQYQHSARSCQRLDSPFCTGQRPRSLMLDGYKLHRLARPQLGQTGPVGRDHPGNHRIASRHRSIPAQDDRLTVRRNLNRTRQHALRRQLNAGDATPSAQAGADPVDQTPAPTWYSPPKKAARPSSSN